MRDTEKAFTLVELLVVLSIMVMLLGILMPALAAARRVAYKTACKQNLHGCALAFRMYLDDNKSIMPIITNMPNAKPPVTDNPIPVYAVLGKYLSGPQALKCPADPQAKYFREQGSSYEYNTRLAGENIEKSRFAQRFGLNEVFLLRDYSAFHGTAGKAGSVMYLFADTLVADRERNK
jgi:prepilin-type N-terminal cleavage/methylation domain-containing protein